ncbi:hypothetical protein LWI29_010283 [Acer saccharum]|uniref:Uncharacterized protein n=1 Tax=Acer saccharum TaxID=4024 RepID=A0AA39RUE8_ACESA|nr:hypothetical protein LWI29_010283 [Acer saccharum]
MHLINFIPVTVPCVDGLPPGTEATTDVSYPLHPLVMTLMDLTEPAIEAILSVLKPHFVLYDYTHWLPTLAHKLGIKAILYCVVSSVTIGYLLSPERKILTQADMMNPPPGPELPEPPRSVLEPTWVNLLGGFEAKSLINCAFGSDCIMNKNQFRELVLGFELTGLSFLAALKPPIGCDTIESTLPEGWEKE